MQSRQEHSVRKAHGGERLKACAARLSAYIIPYDCIADSTGYTKISAYYPKLLFVFGTIEYNKKTIDKGFLVKKEENMKKHVRAIFAALLAVLILAGCSASLPGADTSAPVTQAETEPAETAPAPAPASDFSYKETDDGTVKLFGYKGDLREIVIPSEINGKSVTVIERGFAPYHFPKAEVTAVYLPDTIKEIGMEAFKDYTGLRRINLPEGLEVIGEEAFANCASLKEITLPGSLKSFDSAFYHSGVETLTVSEGIKTIAYNSFCGAKIRKLVLPNGVKSIDSDAFYDCAELESVTFSEGLEEIRAGAFGGTNKLTSVTLPATVKSIYETSFFLNGENKVFFEGDAPEFVRYTSPTGERNEEITYVFHESAKGLSYPRWYGYKTEIAEKPNAARPVSGDYEYAENDTGITVCAYIGTGTDVTVPAEINGKPVTKIGESAFFAQNAPTSILLPDTVTEIGEYAFANCASLVSVDLPSGLRRIGSHAFRQDKQISNLILPEGLVEIGEEAFCYTAALKSVTIPSSLKVWGDGMFRYSGLEIVTLKNGLTEIGKGAFAGTSLTEIILPDSLRVVGKNAFSGCPVTKVVLNEGLVEIEFCAFAYFKNPALVGIKELSPTEIVIPASVTKLSDAAFADSSFRALKFEGAAPEILPPVETVILPGDENGPEEQTVTAYVKKSNVTVFFHEGSAGFTQPKWNGYQTEIW